MSEDKVVSHLDAYIAGKLLHNDKWQSVGIQAGLSTDVLAAIKKNFPEHLYCFATILAWRRQSGGLPLGDLIATLDRVQHDFSSEDLQQSLDVIPPKSWRNLGRKLGTTEEDLDMIEKTFTSGDHKRVMAVLLNWQSSKPELCTLGNLFTAVRYFKDPPTMSSYELWASYQELESLNANQMSVVLGIDFGELWKHLDHFGVEQDLHGLVVLDEWRLQKSKECTLARFFEVLCNLERVEEAAKILEKVREIRWVKKADTRVVQKNNLKRVLDSVPAKEWHKFGRELGLSTLELFGIQRTASENAIIETIRVWMEAPKTGSRTLAFKMAVERSGGVLVAGDEHIYEKLWLQSSGEEPIYDTLDSTNSDEEDYVTLDTLQLTKTGLIYVDEKLRQEGPYENVFFESASSSSESPYYEITVTEKPKELLHPLVEDMRCDIIKTRYFSKQEEEYLIPQLRLGYIITGKKQSSSALKKTKKVKAVVVELSERVVVACVDVKAKTHYSVPLHKFWTDDLIVRVDNSEDEYLQVWPTREIIKRATQYESFGVNAKSSDEFVKWCRYDGIYLPVHWKQVMSAAAKRLTAHEPETNSRRLSEEDVAEVTMRILQDLQATEAKPRRRRASDRRLTMYDIEEMERAELEEKCHPGTKLSNDAADKNDSDDVCTVKERLAISVQTSAQTELSSDGWTQTGENADNKGKDSRSEETIEGFQQEAARKTREENCAGGEHIKGDVHSNEGVIRDQTSKIHDKTENPDARDNLECKSPYYKMEDKYIFIVSLRNGDILDMKSQKLLGALFNFGSKFIVVEEGLDPQVACMTEDGQHMVQRLENIWDNQEIRINNSVDKWCPVLPMEEVLNRARNGPFPPGLKDQFVMWCRYGRVLPPLDNTMKMMTVLAANITFLFVGPFHATLVLATGVVITKVACSNFIKSFIFEDFF